MSVLAEAIPGSPQSAPPLLASELRMHPAGLAALIVKRIEDEDGLDAYLLSASLRQTIEDLLEPDTLRLAAVQRVGSGALVVAARMAMAVISRVRSLRRGGLVELDRSIGDLVDGLADCLVANTSPSSELPKARSVAAALAGEADISGALCRPPSSFLAFDEHPDDLGALAAKLSARALGERVVIVGVRTSGSFLAPLLAAHLRRSNAGSIAATTMRPFVAMAAHKKGLLRGAATVVVTDDSPASGESLAAAAAAVERVGPAEREIVLAVPMLSSEDTLPAILRRFPAVILTWKEWAVHRRLEPSAVERTLRALVPPLAFDTIERVTSEGPPDRGHTRARYRLVGATAEDADLLVEGVGLGYFGAHRLAVEQALPEWLAPAHGLADGLLYRRWLPEERRVVRVDAEIADGMASYVRARRSRLPLATDFTDRLGGQDPVWEVAATLLSRAYGRGWRAARVIGLDAMMRDLLRAEVSSVIDGRMGHGWFMDGDQRSTLKLNAAERAFSNRNLACSDAIYDLAAAAAAWPEQSAAIRRSFEQAEGHPVDEERWLLFTLVALWAARRDKDLSRESALRAQARALQDYFAATLLNDLPPARKGPICALDLDGVLETETLGFLGTSPAGALALRALRAHGYSTVLVSGRSAGEVQERCERYGLEVGVAEYGAVVVGGERRGLLADSQAAAVDRLRDRLRDMPDVVIGADHEYVVRASALAEADGRRVPLGEAATAAARAAASPVEIRAIVGEEQTDLVPVGIDKGYGVRELADCQGAELPLAFAAGDTAEDLAMFALARMATAPANASEEIRAAGVSVSRRTYQPGLVEAVGKLIGHRPGSCPACRVPAQTSGRRALMGVLGARERGSFGMAAGLVRLGLNGCALMSVAERVGGPPAGPTGLRSRFGAHARVPLFRDGYALALNSAVTAVLGLAYWVVAAHVYSPYVVGINSALIAAMMFVAGIATLNLSNVLVRFLPEGGDRARRFVAGSYAVTAATAALLSAVLVFKLVELPEELRFFNDVSGLAPAFAVATIVWCIFVLQDAVLTGIGRAVWVPLENGVFAVLKLGLLVAFAGVLSEFGIFASWAIAMGLCVIGVNVIMFARLLPERRGGAVAPNLVRTRAFAGYFVADWACAISWLAGTTLLPVVVTSVAGADTNATFALSWAVAFPLYAVSTAIGTALVVHGSKSPGDLPALIRQSFWQGAAILGACVAVLVIAAPLALQLFGDDYAAEGATLLRILALGALPNLVVALWLARARVLRRLRLPAVLLCGQAVLTLILVGPLLNSLGATGAGVAWAIGQTALAAGVLAVGVVIRRPRRRDAHVVRTLTGARTLQRLPTDSDVRVVAAVSEDGSRQLVKFGESATARARLARHVQAVATLRAMSQLGAWRRLLPVITHVAETTVVERAILGVDGRRLPADRVLSAATSALPPFYAATEGDVSDDLLARWVEARREPLVKIAGDRGRAFTERLETTVAGRAARGGWVHGDLWAGNLLLSADGSSLTGIVDWEAAQPNDLPIADVAHLLVCLRMQASGRPLGTVVRRLADGTDELTAAERRLLDGCLPSQADPLDDALLAHLGWLHHVAMRVGQTPKGPSVIWVRRTVRPVLEGAR